MVARPEAIPLAEDASGRFLGWLVGVMTYLAILSVSGALAAHAVANAWDLKLSGSITIQVPAPQTLDADGIARRDAAVTEVLRVLSVTPGIGQVTPLSTTGTRALIEPWIGADLAARLPLPLIIDVTAGSSTPADLELLAARLEQIAPDIVIDDHGRWITRLARLAGSAELLGGAVLLVIGLVSVVSVIFAVRTGLATHRPIVDLLHIMGARDAYIAARFQRHVASAAGKGAAVGTAAGLLTAFLLALFVAGWDSTRLSLNTGLLPEAVALAVTPLMTVGLAMMAARWSVLALLRRSR